MPVRLYVLVVAVLTAAIGIGLWVHYHSSSAAADYHCVAGPSEQCASDLWIAEYREWKAFQRKYAPPQAETDRIQGMLDRMRGEIPQGMQWDDAKLRFVKAPPQPATPPAIAQPAPTPSPTPSK